MAVPENYQKLGTVGIAYKGEYQSDQQYKYTNAVYYDGSTYIALKDDPEGEPEDDRINWMYLARGTVNSGAVVSVNGQTGVVKLTAKDIGAVATDGDTADNTVEFTSNDTINDDATSWTVVPKLESGIEHSTFAQRISQMFKNVRYLYNMLGTTDISSIGGGTVTGAISKINSVLNVININYLTANITNAVTLPANMGNDYMELCRTNIALDPGIYFACYRMTSNNDNVDYQMRRTVDESYLTGMSGQNGSDIFRLTFETPISIVARNRGKEQAIYGASGNNRFSVIRLR